MDGIYAGVPYNLERIGLQINIILSSNDLKLFESYGADMTILENIGEQDPDDVMAALFESIPKKDGE